MASFLLVALIGSVALWVRLFVRARRQVRSGEARDLAIRIAACTRTLPTLTRYIGQPLVDALEERSLNRLLKDGPPVDEFIDAVLHRFGRDSGFSLGSWIDGDLALPIRLQPEDRSRHLYIVGRSGSGKTTLVRNLILQDLETGCGLAVLAPEQELLAEEILPFIPESRMDDVVYVNPADGEQPVPLNPLHLAPGEDVDLKVDEMLTIFRRVFSQDGGATPRMEAILREVLHTLIAIPGTTLLDVERLLDRADPSFRSWAMKQVKDEESKRFWTVTYPAYPKDAHLPIVNRLRPFLRPAVVRNVLCTPGESLDVRKAMDERKILLFNLSDGLLGEANAQLLGQLIVAKLQLAAMSRANVPAHERPFFALYIDEFQSFCGVAGTSYEKMLSRARKYGLGLILAHQQTGQIPPPLLREILGNVSTVVTFSVSAADARKLSAELGSSRNAEPEVLQRLRTGHAVARIGTTTFDLATDPPPTGGDARVRDTVITRSRMRYGVLVGSTNAENGDSRPRSLDDLDTGAAL